MTACLSSPSVGPTSPAAMVPPRRAAPRRDARATGANTSLRNACSCVVPSWQNSMPEATNRPMTAELWRALRAEHADGPVGRQAWDARGENSDTPGVAGTREDWLLCLRAVPGA